MTESPKHGLIDVWIIEFSMIGYYLVIGIWSLVIAIIIKLSNHYSANVNNLSSTLTSNIIKQITNSNDHISLTNKPLMIS